jgi:hypothetical protein
MFILPMKNPEALVMFPLTVSDDSVPTLVMFGCAAVDNSPTTLLPLIVDDEWMLPATSRVYAGLLVPIPNNVEPVPFVTEKAELLVLIKYPFVGTLESYIRMLAPG